MVPGNETRTSVTSRMRAVFGGARVRQAGRREKRWLALRPGAICELFDQLDDDAARELTFDFQEGRCELAAFMRGRRGRPQIFDGAQLPDKFIRRRDVHPASARHPVDCLFSTKKDNEAISVVAQKAGVDERGRAAMPGTRALCPG